ncbi:transglycosylase domain-containing protein [Methylomicrobium sp. RS1]|jgi:membrane peptidoglycan carboxypeptidase|uniref:transglycosylase domain-containing protein n=1 Tax=Candidatus Methylomicrobium oryzae TaxID=2802053 RepID=UPI0019241D6C|nr:transglycosylase domain-containing protein [Methylomicrobium sp. RS1]MBL1264351.1 transglycosylase domain-containing protein [Methylomicrobium sp. RS1]
MQNKRRILPKIVLLGLLAGLLIVGIAVVKFVREEVETSRYQAHYLSNIGKRISFRLEKGPSPSIRYPEYGPYDQRMGYTLLPEAVDRMTQAGFSVSAQAVSSPMLTQLVDDGFFSIYHEKTQAGLKIYDQTNQLIFRNTYPNHGYPSFESIPPLVLYTLLFIENRELLNEAKVTLNPAVEWDRLGYASLQMVANKLGVDKNVPGGSTLATQIEKYRHSPNGYTNSVIDKFRQMGSASIRAYLWGADTREMRRQIALAYLNSMPLSAAPKVGEVHGLGDGLAAWFGADFDEVNNLLRAATQNSGESVTDRQATAFRQVLCILLSQRRPSHFLGPGFHALQTLANSYLRLMADAGVISGALRDRALKAETLKPLPAESMPVTQFVSEKKTQAVLRARLAQALNVKTIYDLDRLDLTAKTTIDYNTQQAVATALRKLSDPEEARAAGAFGERRLNENVDLSRVVYSLMLFEKTPKGNFLRVQTDNLDQPLDINEGIRLDLGSTSKLRTMVLYLQLVAELYQQYHGQSLEELNKVVLHPRDYLSDWVITQLKAQPKIGLQTILDQALDRKYSASPGEYFFTGGGLHHFNNFQKSDDYQIMSVRDALRDSVNLVFIRLMRDIVYHYQYRPDGIARWLDDPESPKRQEYLERFADREAQVYLGRFFAKVQGKSEAERLDMLAKRVWLKSSRLTMLYRAIYPDHDVEQLNKFLRNYLPKQILDKEDIYALYDKYSADKFDLQDQGYITKIHPLELWLAGYLAEHPQATREEVIAASAKQRLEVYRWLLKSKRKKAGQQHRIMSMLEAEAFQKIHAAWKQVGYPFGRLTPSYATSIGASGDRPAALADLVGVILNDGVRMPSVRFENLHFAEGTPYETILDKTPNEGKRVFPPEVARAARSAMVGVVEGGTAARLKGVYTDNQGQVIPIGGKTGTGDHRKEMFNARGHMIGSQFISRAAVFTFFMGDRFFGVITAYVAGKDAGDYHFTSSLPVQIVRFLKPTLMPLLNRSVDDGSGNTLPEPKMAMVSGQ